MKKIVFLILLLSCYTKVSAQCQLCSLNEENAKKVIDFLQFETELVLYYSDCNNSKVKDIARHVKIDKVSYQPADRKDYFQIYIEGVVIGVFDIENQAPLNYVKNDMKFAGVIDIAYTHIRSRGYTDETTGKNVWDAVCLGIYLGFECDPCIDPFDYPSVEE